LTQNRTTRGKARDQAGKKGGLYTRKRCRVKYFSPGQMDVLGREGRKAAIEEKTPSAFNGVKGDDKSQGKRMETGRTVGTNLASQETDFNSLGALY